MLGESRTGTSESLMKQQRVLVYEAQRNELGEAARFRLDVAQNIPVIKFGKIPRKPALNAHLGRTQIPCFLRFPGHIVEIVKVRIRFARAAAECAELASYEADIREIDVPVDDIGDNVSH